VVGNVLCPRIVPPGCRRFTCDLQSKQGGECLFAKYILRRTDAELATLEGVGETVSEWETKWEILVNYLF